MKQILKLIRWPNLLMMGLLQYLLRYAMAAPILEESGQGLLLEHFEFAILVVSCMLIAAGGYIINDIEDKNIDSVNHPSKQIIGQSLSEDAAFKLYAALSGAGILMGFYLTFARQYEHIAMIELVSAGLLYFYSTSYKCIPLLGNLIISALSALLVLMVILPEPLAKINPAVMIMTEVFMAFVFISTLIREIIKDAEDITGDTAYQCQTLASVMGWANAKWICVILEFLMLAAIVFIQYQSSQWESMLPFLYITLLIDLPLIYVLILTLKAKEISDFHKLSNWMKLIMFTGIVSLVVFYISFL